MTFANGFGKKWFHNIEKNVHLFPCSTISVVFFKTQSGRKPWDRQRHS